MVARRVRLAYVQLIKPTGHLWVIGGVILVSHATGRWPPPPSWSPGGDVVAAEWPVADRVEVIAVDVDGDHWVSLTPAEANDGSPAWRPTLPG